MNPDDLAAILDELGRRLGPTGEHVFGLAVRQAFIDGIVALVVTIATVACLVLMFRWIGRYVVEDKAKAANNSYYTSSYESAYVFGGVGFLVLALVIVWAGSVAISNLLNPEYAALRDILGAIGNAR